MGEPVLGNEDRVGQVVERRHAGAEQFIGGVLRPERPEQHVHGHRVRGGKVRREGAGDVPSAIEQLEVPEAARRRRHERLRTKRGIDARQVAGEATHERRREEHLEGLGHARHSSVRRASR